MKKNKQEAELYTRLTNMQYDVTQNKATEPPFVNAYWDNELPGIYVDIVTRKPIFSSLDKFESGCGWPSFSKPLVNLIEKQDITHNMIRTEVRNIDDSSHLGHLFEDGPKELGGLRYCINSASLEFITVENLEKAGFGEYLKFFNEAKKC